MEEKRDLGLACFHPLVVTVGKYETSPMTKRHSKRRTIGERFGTRVDHAIPHRHVRRPFRYETPPPWEDSGTHIGIDTECQLLLGRADVITRLEIRNRRKTKALQNICRSIVQ